MAFEYQKPSSSYSDSSSTSSLANGRLVVPISCSTSPASPINRSSSNVLAPATRSTTTTTTPSLSRSDSLYCGSRGIDIGGLPLELDLVEEFTGEPISAPISADSISVTVRFRPLSSREIQRGDEIAWYPDGDYTVRNEYNPATAYAFDRVFGPSTTSEMVYDVAARPVIKSAMEGINGTVFAYGVTSSGKTHTMHGDQMSPGIIPLAIMDVFNIIQDIVSSQKDKKYWVHTETQSPGREFLLRVSYLEIYNEVINDLLDPTGQNLRVREDAQGTYVEGIKEEVVLSPGHALSFIAAGEEHRHVGSNNVNLMSSRSHTIFTMMIESSAHGDEYDGVIFSQLNLIDLAGSESSKTETTGLRRKEGSYINKSLLTLGTVIGKLSEGRASHVPYRDSKLTRLLQSSLSGRGHVSLICTVTPASSNMEETHNTLKFASRAKRVEIYASCNRIVDEKSLIKKYQREISTLKQELDQLKKGVLTGVNHEEIMSLKQKLEERQVKMQSRLEEEEEEKTALMSRIQRLTKLILVSTKNTIPGLLSDASSEQHYHPSGEDEKLNALCEGSPLHVEGNDWNDPSAALVVPTEQSSDLKHGSSSIECSDEQLPFNNAVTVSTQACEPISGIAGGPILPTDEITMSDQMELMVEHFKMLGGEIAFNTSTLKRLVEQSKIDPDGLQSSIQNLEREIEEKRRQMKVLEQHIKESRKVVVANTTLVEMQQTIMRLMTQCNEKEFELEITSADNRVLQQQFQNKCSEYEEVREKLLLLQQQLASTSYTDHSSNKEYIDELKRKIQSQEIENERLRFEHVRLMEDISGLHVQNHKLAEEASYAKELASAAAVELKNLASEITKLSVENARQAKELLAAKEMAYSRGSDNNSSRNYYEIKGNNMKLGRKGQSFNRGCEVLGTVNDDSKYYNIDPNDTKTELQARKQREAALEAALAEEKRVQEDYKKTVDEARKREAALENDLANMWVLVAKLKKGQEAVQEFNVDRMPCEEPNLLNGLQKNIVEDKLNGIQTNEVEDKLNGLQTNVVEDKLNSLQTNVAEDKDNVLGEVQVLGTEKRADGGPELEPMIARLKARMQEMKEKKLDSIENGDAIPHVYKI